MYDAAVTKVRFDRVQFISRAELSVSQDWIHRSHKQVTILLHTNVFMTDIDLPVLSAGNVTDLKTSLGKLFTRGSGETLRLVFYISLHEVSFRKKNALSLQLW